MSIETFLPYNGIPLYDDDKAAECRKGQVNTKTTRPTNSDYQNTFLPIAKLRKIVLLVQLNWPFLLFDRYL